MHRHAWLALVLATGCSALVAPDTNRLGGDTGIAPGTDGGPGVCAGGQITCGGTCVAPATDPNHCGGCGRQCAAGQSCVSGACSGDPGTILGNPGDCGPTHARCSALELCLSGTCACRPGYVSVGGSCVDLTTDPANCGAPGHACPGVCAAGTCIPGDCPRGTTSCDGACVDLRRDPGNCGRCGETCNGRQICIGECRDVTVPTQCTSCPCDACGGGARCCAYPSLGAPVCVDNVDTCPG